MAIKPTRYFPSDQNFLEEIVENQEKAAEALRQVAANVIPTALFIEVHDNVNGRPILITILDIARVEELAGGNAQIITVTDSNLTVSETYAAVRALMGV